MDDLASDIKELKKILDDGGSYDELCDKVIEIGRRIVDGAERYSIASDLPRHEFDRLFKDSQDLYEIIKKIEQRRGKKALERYKAWEDEIDLRPSSWLILDWWSSGWGVDCDVRVGPCACGAWHIHNRKA